MARKRSGLTWNGNQKAQAEADAAWAKLKAKQKPKRPNRPPSIRTRKQRRDPKRMKRAAEYLGVSDEAWLAGAPVSATLVREKAYRDQIAKRRKQPECYICGAVEPLAPRVAGERPVCLYCFDKR